MQLFKHIFHQLIIYWLLTYTIHSIFVSFFDIGIFCVSRNCDNHRLRKTFRVQIISDLICGIVAIKDWHVAIHKNQVEVAKQTVVETHVLLNEVNGLLSIHCADAYLLDIFHVKPAFKSDLSCFNIKNFIVNY